MRVTYATKMIAICPIDGLPDAYDVELTAERVIHAEDILALRARLANQKMFQEDLTSEVARQLGCGVRCVGYHSGVRTEVEA